MVAATQGPIAVSAFGAQVSGVAWKTKPSWYIVSTLDGAIAPDEERFFAKRMKATTTALKASHASMLSQTKDVAAVVMDAAAKAPHQVSEAFIIRVSPAADRRHMTRRSARKKTINFQSRIVDSRRLWINYST